MSDVVEQSIHEIRRYSIVKLQLFSNGYMRECTGFINRFNQFVPLVKTDNKDFNFKTMYPIDYYKFIIGDPFSLKSFNLQTNNKHNVFGTYDHIDINYISDPVPHDYYENNIEYIYFLIVRKPSDADPTILVHDYLLARPPFNTKPHTTNNTFAWLVFCNKFGWIPIEKLEGYKDATVIGWSKTYYEEYYENITL